MINAVRRRLHGCPRPQDDDAGVALIFVLVFMLIISTISLAALASLTTEIGQTLFARKHAQTVNTSLAGLQAGLNRIRASVDVNTGAGVTSLLPCQSGGNTGTLAGSIDTAGKFTYSTTIYYLTSDPSLMTEAQAAAAAMSCPLSTVPTFAYLVSAGSQPALTGHTAGFGNRTLHAVYDFSTGSGSTLGGQIKTTNSLCWDAGSYPAVGSQVTLQACQSAGAPTQSWYFRRDLTIQWMGDQSANLCLDYRGVIASPVSYLATLQTCLGAGIAGTAYDSLNQKYPVAGLQYQEFVLANWLQSVTANGDAGSAYAASSYTPSSGQYQQFLAGDLLVMSPSYWTQSYLSFSASVGAGGTAGITNGLPSLSEQLVNLAYSQDCLDVAGSYPPNGLIHYPCHQAPDSAKVTQNQRFQYGGTTSAPGPLSSVRTDDTSGWSNYAKVCAQSDGTSTVKLLTCVSGQTNQQWQLTGYRNGDYPGSYLLMDYTGQCITATGGYSLALLACNGSTTQKWNAPPVPLPSELTAVQEK